MNHILFQNVKTHQQPNQFMQSVWQLISNLNGWLVERNANSFTFEYFILIDQFEAKRAVLCLECRKNSYKLTITTQISIQGLEGGISRIGKIIDKSNSDLGNDLSTYAFSEPNLLIGKLILEKETETIEFASEYLSNILSEIHTNFKKVLSKIISLRYEQVSSMKKIRDVLDLINISKVYFDFEIKKREHSKNIDKQYQLVQPNMNQSFFIDEGRYALGEDLNKLNAAFRKIKEDRDRNIREMVIKPLVHKIKMLDHKIDETWKPPVSVCGSLQMVKAEYLLLESYNNETAEMLMKEFKMKEKIDKRTLIRKNRACSKCLNESNSICQCDIAVKSFETEVEIIMYIRNMVTESVAEYFLEENLFEKGQISNLYSKFYPRCLMEENLKPKYFFPFLLNILGGLEILKESSIIHRDLKPHNIMIDSKSNPKLIDFGSAFQRQNLIPSSKNDHELITTRKYNLFYEEAIFSDKNKFSLKEFEQHELYDMHAFGIILRELYTDPKISSELGPLLLPNLSWLSIKCCTHNPNLRMNHEEVIYFMTLMAKVWTLKEANV